VVVAQGTLFLKGFPLLIADLLSEESPSRAPLLGLNSAPPGCYKEAGGPSLKVSTLEEKFPEGIALPTPVSPPKKCSPPGFVAVACVVGTQPRARARALCALVKFKKGVTNAPIFPRVPQNKNRMGIKIEPFKTKGFKSVRPLGDLNQGFFLSFPGSAWCFKPFPKVWGPRKKPGGFNKTLGAAKGICWLKNPLEPVSGLRKAKSFK